MLKLRLLTALILIPLVILGIFYLPRPFFVLITFFIFSLAAWEWARLSGWTTIWLKLVYVFLMLVGMIATNRLISDGAILTIAIGALWWFIVAIWILKIRKASQLFELPRWSVLLCGFFVLLPCWQAILWLEQQPALLFYMLLMIWLCDSAAYFGGKQWGKKKLAVTISPNKTFEGLYAGTMTTVIASFLLCWFIFTPQELELSWLLPILPLIAASVVGDLFESALKRMQNLKDSGGLLPGHGGVLDRIDSLTAAAPVFTCAMIFLRQAGY